jgi:hypothetical protein
LSGRNVHRALKKKGALGFLLAIREPKSPGSKPAIVLPYHDDLKIRGILQRCSDVFKDELPESLPLERNIEYNIDTGDARPVNVNSYPLSDKKLRE